MEKSTFILTYLLTFSACLAVTVGLILLINKGLKKYFENLSGDADIARFFIKLTNAILLLCGVSAALPSVYDTAESANWLTLTWDIAKHLESSLDKLYITLMIFAVVFFVLHLIARRINK